MEHDWDSDNEIMIIGYKPPKKHKWKWTVKAQTLENLKKIFFQFTDLVAMLNPKISWFFTFYVSLFILVSIN